MKTKKTLAAFIAFLSVISVLPTFSQQYVSITGNNVISDGLGAGSNFTGNYSNLLGYYTGVNSTSTYSNMLGFYAGYGSKTTHSNIFGYNAGRNVLTGSHNNFLGFYAGYNSSGDGYNNYIGYYAGFNGSGEGHKNNFIGYRAGYNASGVGNNFIGYYAGEGVKNNSYSNSFIGGYAGYGSDSINYSIYMGPSSGRDSRKNNSCTFLGIFAGHNTSNIQHSIFVGTGAGQGTSSSYSVLIGLHAGHIGASGEKIGNSNILIGTNTTLPNGASNSLNIGNVIYGTGMQAGYEGYSTYTPTADGKIGIGTVSPAEKLTVAGGHADTKIRLSSTGNGSDQPSNLSLWASEPGLTYCGAGIGYNVNGSPYYGRIDNSKGSSYIRFLPGETKFVFQKTSGETIDAFTIQETGNIGIGTTAPDTKLDVAGTIRAHEVRVCLNQGCDFVFDSDYQLMPLNELDKFITTNKHLPEVAPAAVMESEGIDLSEMNAKLLQKVEELTLYVIELNKRITELEGKD